MSIQGGRLTFYAENSIVIDKKNQFIPDDFKISYSNNDLNKLVRTNIYFWNNGHTVIHKNDIAEGSKICIEFNERVQIYSCNIVKNTDSSNGIVLTEKLNSKVNLSFNYLEPKDGVRIEILHNDETTLPTITGKIIGIKGGIKNSVNSINSKLNSIFYYLGSLWIYIILFIISCSLLSICGLINKYLIKQDCVIFIGFIFSSLVPAIISPFMLKSHTKIKKYPSMLDQN